MILADYHTHTEFSTDSEAAVEDMVKAAIKKGLKIICITDHFDRNYPEIPEEAVKAGRDFEFNPKEYFDKIYELKHRYKNDIKVLCGVELGLRNEPENMEEIKAYYDKLLDEYDFDFAIGSTHVLENLDPYYEQYWEGKTKKDGISAYFKSIAQNAAYYKNFMIYGHLDYLIRYVPDSVKDYDYSEYKELIDEALNSLINSGRGVELNSSGYKYGLEYPHPKPEILKRYRELGGEILTIGSDAHAPEHIAYDFKRAEELLKNLGFKYYTVFEKRKPEFIKL